MRGESRDWSQPPGPCPQEDRELGGILKNRAFRLRGKNEVSGHEEDQGCDQRKDCFLLYVTALPYCAVITHPGARFFSGEGILNLSNSPKIGKKKGNGERAM